MTLASPARRPPGVLRSPHRAAAHRRIRPARQPQSHERELPQVNGWAASGAYACDRVRVRNLHSASRNHHRRRSVDLDRATLSPGCAVLEMLAFGGSCGRSVEDPPRIELNPNEFQKSAGSNGAAIISCSPRRRATSPPGQP